jgi:sugar transferase (PEP-CTERM/EpsH1 system associated)
MVMQDLLFLAHRLPYPPNKGDKIRSWHIFQHLARRFRVHLGCFIDDADDQQYIETVTVHCASHRVIRLDKRVAMLRGGLSLLRGGALSIAYFHDRQLQSWVDDTLTRHRPAVAFAYCSAMAPYVMIPKADGMRRIVDMVDVDSDKWRQYAASRHWPLSVAYAREAAALLSSERKIASAFDATLFVSEAEADLFRRLAPESVGRVHAVANGVDCDYFDPHRAYDNPYAAGDLPIVFTGAMDYWPNVDAVTWFAQQVMPLLAGQSRLRFFIVGSNPSPSVQALAQDSRIIVTGRVPDVRPYLAHATIAVAPLRIARGIQNKVLEALAMGRPIIASPAALEGIGPDATKYLAQAHSAKEFAAAIGRILDGSVPSLATAASACARERYGWSRSFARLDEFVGDTVPDVSLAKASGE